MLTSVEGGFKLAFICGLHLLAFGTLATSGMRPQPEAAISRLDVRIIDEQPRLQPPPPTPPRAKPAPLRARPAPAPQVKSAPPPPVTASAPPLMTSAAEVSAPVQSFTVAPQPPAPTPAPAPAAKIETAAAPPPAAPAPPVPAPAAPAPPVIPPRFDADYLHNPAPAYPRASRVAGQQGQVMLKVLVSDQGAALNVQLQRSCGFARLDDAALDAVRQWRFVPARRGAEPVEDWVLVPIAFRLDA